MLKAPALTRNPRIWKLVAPLLTLVVLVACTPPDGQNPPPPPPEGELRLAQVATGLNTPVALTNAGDDRLFVAERAGRVRIIRNGALQAEPFLDLTASVASSEGEQGLAGLAFPPDHDTSGLFYVYYTAASNGRGQLVRMAVDATNPDRADPATLEVLVELAESTTYHNGGQLAFGPDDYLYWAVGDGAVGSRAQSRASWRGKIHRLDVSTAPGYEVPADNPLVGEPGVREEIWAMGLRNPWRFSFDSATGAMYLADVGEDAFEEVNVVPAGQGGANFGWPVMEGPECFEGASCDQEGLTLPTFSYPHPSGEGGASVTGGYVYRGPAAPDLVGRYVFADFIMNSLSSAAAGNGWQIEPLLDDQLRTASFGVGDDERLYVTDFVNGRVLEVTQEE